MSERPGYSDTSSGGISPPCAALILAAGKGTRMKSDLPKVLHQIAGQSLVQRVINSARSSSLNPVVLVLGHKADLVKGSLSGDDLRFVIQEPQNGTGHAVQVSEPELRDLEGDLLVLVGDAPLIRSETLDHLLTLHRSEGAAATVLSAELDDPTGYGRIIRDGTGDVIAIREHRDATDQEREIREINSGIYCFRVKDLLSALGKLDVNNDQGELYLTDTLAILRGDGERVLGYVTDDPLEISGINDTEQLKALEQAWLARGE
jgi:UDP-N-acetylglucosamine diphosphorylase/glucosamine-1-phosphate N-acetyltransferase